jgi:hypothetical protein
MRVVQRRETLLSNLNLLAVLGALGGSLRSGLASTSR